MTVALPVQRWRSSGVRAAGTARRCPTSMPPASLVSGATRHFLVYANYDALLDYNCAHSYALSVGLLADRLSGPAPRTPRPPKKKVSSRRRAH